MYPQGLEARICHALPRTTVEAFIREQVARDHACSTSGCVGACDPPRRLFGRVVDPN